MPLSSPSRQSATAQDIIERARGLAPRFAKRADAAEEARHIPAESVKDMLDAGFARILLPREIGGYGLGFDAWYRGDARTQQGRCVARLVRRPHHPPRSSDRAVSARRVRRRSGPEASMYPSPLRSRRREGRAGGRRLSHLRCRLAVCQRRRSLHLGHARRHDTAMARSRNGNSFWSRRANTPSATPGSPPACAAPAARPSSSPTLSCRTAAS